ncbi:MAG TPA: hypothetical protein VJL37_01830 [Flavobacterium sp.]|nr:hypothetical protein [Flavobacterium sp.]
MKLFLKLIVLTLVLLNLSCSYNRVLLKDKNKYVTHQFRHLKNESTTFLSHPRQNDFEKKLFNYLKNCKDYNFFDGREEPVLLFPLVISSDSSQVIAFIVKRGYDNSHQDLDYVKFISAKRNNNTWLFDVRKGHSFSFSYVDSATPRLTNDKMAEETIRNLMLMGYFKNNRDDKSIFKSDWYVF